MYIDVAINFLLFQKATFMSDIKVSSKVKFLKWHGLFRRKYSGFEYKLENYQLLSRSGGKAKLNILLDTITFSLLSKKISHVRFWYAAHGRYPNKSQ